MFLFTVWCRNTLYELKYNLDPEKKVENVHIGTFSKLVVRVATAATTHGVVMRCIAQR